MRYAECPLTAVPVGSAAGRSSPADEAVESAVGRDLAE